MNATRYAKRPPRRNVKMSVCHIWFGVARSNLRGRDMFRFGSFFSFTAGISSAACSARRTDSGLACRKNIRRSTCEIRRTPCCGSAAFNATICACTGPAISVPWPRR